MVNRDQLKVGQKFNFHGEICVVDKVGKKWVNLTVINQVEQTTITYNDLISNKMISNYKIKHLIEDFEKENFFVLLEGVS